MDDRDYKPKRRRLAKALRHRGMGLGTYFRPLYLVALTPSQICRAFLVRNHAAAGPLIDRLLTLFTDENIGWDAARAIGQIGRTDNVLTKRNHAVVRVSS